LHPKHPLFLTHYYLYGGQRKCSGCSRENIWGLSYHCYDCNFSLESTCASLPLTVQTEIHREHPLTLVRRSVSFTCDACGKEGKGMFYLCALCPFLVHTKCISYPLLVKHIRHRHPLHLTKSLKPHPNQSDHRLCPLCLKNVNTNYMVYYCSTGDFITHPHCAANIYMEGQQWERIESTSMLKYEDPGLDGRSINPLQYFVEKFKLGEENIKIAVEIKHISHEHDLKLIDVQLENDEKCDGCMWPISPPFYTCTPCRFFLHKSCVELPSKKSHSLHQHPLILLTEPPDAVTCFICDACKRPCNGFIYRCDKCDFQLDVQCSLRSDIMNHKGHEPHQLILSSTSNYGECSSCDNHGIIFGCASSDDCKFTLDFKCATLPAIIRYRSHEESFKLCYKREDDSDDKYNCDICEQPRNPKHWFYYCADLDFPAHPECILGEFPNIKFGKTYKFDTHEHRLAFVDREKGAYPPCNTCGDSCIGWTFECVKCNFSFHSWCVVRRFHSWSLRRLFQ
jgi:hypothetical protein